MRRARLWLNLTFTLSLVCAVAFGLLSAKGASCAAAYTGFNWAGVRAYDLNPHVITILLFYELFAHSLFISSAFLLCFRLAPRMLTQSLATRQHLLSRGQAVSGDTSLQFSQLASYRSCSVRWPLGPSSNLSSGSDHASGPSRPNTASSIRIFLLNRFQSVQIYPDPTPRADDTQLPSRDSGPCPGKHQPAECPDKEDASLSVDSMHDVSMRDAQPLLVTTASGESVPAWGARPGEQSCPRMEVPGRRARDNSVAASNSENQRSSGSRTNDSEIIELGMEQGVHDVRVSERSQYHKPQEPDRHASRSIQLPATIKERLSRLHLCVYGVHPRCSRGCPVYRECFVSCVGAAGNEHVCCIQMHANSNVRLHAWIKQCCHCHHTLIAAQEARGKEGLFSLGWAGTRAWGPPERALSGPSWHRLSFS
jgi:hypothetical protein